MTHSGDILMIDMDERVEHTSSASPNVDVSLSELVELCAVDNELFSRTFFSKTVRQASPKFHRQMDTLLDSNHRLVNIQSFRGSAKTSKLRIYTAKRIAYGLAHTILYIGKSEGHALRSVKWLRNAIEHNKTFASVFNLRPGKKWQDSECEIWHGTDAYPIWIVAMGITGSIRGINFDDFRPDLIIIDDAIDEENSATPEQREKIENLILGALQESLAPASEAPDAKMVMLQTPLNKEDASCKAMKSPGWVSAVFGCWTEETKDLPLHMQESAWPERWSSETLREEKRNAIAINKLSLFLREKECRLTSQETSTFKTEWLRYYDVEPLYARTVMAIDPVPPPSPVQIAKGMKGKDYEALAVVGRAGGNYYLLEYSCNRGHEPDWTIAEFFRLCIKWRPVRVVVEAIAYQRTLQWLLKKAMQVQRRYFVIAERPDRRSKYDRIVDGLNGVAANGKFFVKREHADFIEQFTTYPNCANDDLLEAVSVACAELQEQTFEEDEESRNNSVENENAIPALTYGARAISP